MADQDNLSAVLYGANDMRMEQTPMPEPGENQVLIQMEVVGICGSDVHFLKDGKLGPYVVEKPMIMGHESSGTIVKCGEKVTHLKPGDRVAIEPGTSCRGCEYCKTGKYNLCPDMAFCATPPVDGSLRRFYAHDADLCFKLPDNMDFTDGALVEPLAVAVHACKRGHVTVGTVALVLGGGPIGISTMLAAKAMGAKKVLLTELCDIRIEKAKEMGAEYTLKVTTDLADCDIVKQVKEILGEEPTVTFECSGAAQCINVALMGTKSGGKVVLVAMGQTQAEICIGEAIFRQVDIKGIFRYVNNYPTAIDLIQSGKVNLKPMVTHEFSIEDSLKAFEAKQSKESNAIKVHIRCNTKSAKGGEGDDSAGTQGTKPKCDLRCRNKAPPNTTESAA